MKKKNNLVSKGISRAKKLLNWEPLVNLEEGIEEICIEDKNVTIIKN